MSARFPEHKSLNLPALNESVLQEWKKNNTFEKSIETRKGNPAYIFYEGPPSANGKPGIHHVMARAIKDIFCRYKTQKGFIVERKAGWDTHGLPVELGVEKSLGITKEDIGKNISVEEYNQACRTDVMKYTDIWEDLTDKMGYWVDMDNPYITYDNCYIETLWYLLRELYNKDLLYKGYTIQPFSPAAGTGLSSHELNLPGCYQDVKDTTAVALFKTVRNEKSEFIFEGVDTEDVHFMAWTTTPWTLLSNTGLAVGGKIDYQKVRTFNPYTGEPVTVVLAKKRFDAFFPAKNAELKLEDYKKGDKKIPYQIVGTHKGIDFENTRYEQLLPYQQPETGDPFRVIVADFVTTEDGTGIVHIAPSFGADDFRVGQKYNLGSLTLVDRQGKFIEGIGEFSHRYVKNSFDKNIAEDAQTVDVDIAVKLKLEGKCFKVEKYEHSYPHCWRTDKPILYYPLDSWFVKTTAYKDRMVELNKTINWKPAKTGTGRFGQWLENLVDWNLSRSRYWGTPLPIWISEDSTERICIGSVAELKAEIEKSIAAGFMTENPLKNFVEGDNSKENYESFDLHRPFVDDIFLVSETGQKLTREPDLIDVWFDSGAMPYAQLHYPFENKELFEKWFPADFIAEGVDQTRGWFFTLHALSVMLFDSVAYKNIISNGLVLDKHGMKMSKRWDNAVEPFQAMADHGADTLRWYMMTNSQPWDNLKFDISGVEEVKRKFFGTLFNTYSFFALYANVDGFEHKEKLVPFENRPEIDQWIISLLNTLVKDVEQAYESYEPTRVGRLIQHFTIENLSNWYVRLNRKRFWGGKYSEDKIAAYQTLYQCLETISKLIAPVAPFFADQLFNDLNSVSTRFDVSSVHLSEFPVFDENHINKPLEERMNIAQRISSMVLGLRRKVSIKVRQPLQKIIIPVLDSQTQEKIEKIEKIITSEINVKEIEFLDDATSILVKKIKPSFKLLGRKYGKMMKQIAAKFANFEQSDIVAIEQKGSVSLNIDDKTVEIALKEVEITSEDIEGLLVANDGALTVALDVNISEELKQEGIAREFVNRIQNLRKESGLDVTDKIQLSIQRHEFINVAVENYSDYIGNQTLATNINLVDTLQENDGIKKVELDQDVCTYMKIEKI